MIVRSGESYRFEQEVFFDGFLFGSVNGYPNGGEVQIRRGADGFYWDGTTFVVAEQWLSTVVDASNEFHYYDWTVPTSNDGDTYTIRIRVSGDRDTESIGTLFVRPESGGAGVAEEEFDAVDFVTGLPFK